MAEGDLVRPDPMRVNPVYLRTPQEPESPYSSMTPLGDLAESDAGPVIRPVGGADSIGGSLSMRC